MREADLRLAAVERLVTHALVADVPEYELADLGDYLVSMIGQARSWIGRAV
jgi:hypothetical protein